MKSYNKFITELDISLEYHDKLNPKIWEENDSLNPQVRMKLISFINAWGDFAKIPMSEVKDIVLTGGNANFNYTPMSDLDVHLVLDRNKLGDDRAMVDDYLQSKKILWTMTHNIKILGYPVEPYAQDLSEKFHKEQGVYSLKRDTWIQKPTHGKYDFKNDKNLKEKVQFYMDMIDQLIANKSDLSAFDTLKDKIKNMRGAGIQKAGEFSFENLIFKELRNDGYLDKLSKYESSVKDKSLSL
jgi:hypothetical protein